jgi:tRNA dimethylallyltransferase
VLRGVFEGPEADWKLRRELQARADAEGPGRLHDELSRVDPVLAGRLHPVDVRRVIRGLEVYALTGRPLSKLQRQAPLPEESRPAVVRWLLPPRDWLYRRIENRVASMFAAGLVEEVRGLLEHGALGRTARQALGYKEVIDYVQGRQELGATMELVCRRTRQFAKRQHTWFRNLEECSPFPIKGSETPLELAQLLWSPRP